MAKKGKRDHQKREMQMVTEWLQKYHTMDRWVTQVRVGGINPQSTRSALTQSERAMIGGRRRWVDAIILYKDKVSLIEAAIRPNPGKIGQLELYILLWPSTPEYQAWSGLPIDPIFLYAIEDPALNYMARTKGIRCIEYKPAWLEDYKKLLFPRERRGSPSTVASLP